MRTRPLLPLIPLLVLLAFPACGHYDSHVESDDTALGRVVVYRNGIAYYERRAHVEEDALTLTVPHDKVNDFLKSLTVKDAQTGESVPVSYPTRGASKGSTVEMTIQLPGGGPHDVVVTYITEAPAWKPSYRVVVEDGDRVDVQGWAIVDNTSGEDWEGVLVGVGSSSALSFRYDLRSVVHVFREELKTEQRFAQAPPRGDSTHGGGEDRDVLAALDDGDIPRNAGHPQAVRREAVADMAQAPASGGGGGPASTRKAEAVREERAREQHARQAHEDRARARVKQLAERLRQTRGRVVLDGYAGAEERGGETRALDRANALRNKLIAEGVAPGRLAVRAHGPAPGQRPGVKVRVAEQDTASPAGDGRPVGESHFESDTPMTIARGTSAMVSILDARAEGEVVYLYAPDEARGDARFAFKAVRFRNPTDSTLETGPVTVYGDGRFIGEGLTRSIPPGATAVIPFALDRQVVAERSGSTRDRVHRLLTVQRGVVTAEVRHSRETAVTLTNRLQTPTTVLVRHDVQDGWELVESPKLHERIGTSHLFEVTLEPGATRKVVIEETTPLRRTLDLRSTVGVDLVRVWLEEPPEDARLVERLREVLAIHAEMVDHRQAIGSLRDRMGEYRTRMGELHTQIASLRAAKVGRTLLRHLERKLSDVSDRVQAATMEVVDHQEKLMLARVRYQDAVSELTLEEPATADATTEP